MDDEPLAYADEVDDYCPECAPADETYPLYRGERDAPIVCAVCARVILP